MTISDESCGKIQKIVNIIDKFQLVKKRDEEIKNKIYELLTEKNKDEKLKKLYKELDESSKPVRRKIRSIQCYMDKKAGLIKELEKEKKYEEIKIIKELKNLDWKQFLTTLNKLRINNSGGGYFLRLKFYTEINKTFGIFENLKTIRNGEEVISIDKKEIATKIEEKYKELLRDFNGKVKYISQQNEEYKVIELNTNEVKEGCTRAAKDKAISWDLIPGISIRKIIKDINLEKDYQVTMTWYDRITSLLNSILKNYKDLKFIHTSRLFCLNKQAEKPGDINNIRPIAITSTLLKIIESYILERLMKHITDNNILNKKQVGFMPKCSIEMNLLRLRQRVYDAKQIVKYEKIFLYFVDLKSAYDRVNHKKLFEKLNKYKFEKELIETIKTMYSYAKLKIASYAREINVNSGWLEEEINKKCLKCNLGAVLSRHHVCNVCPYYDEWRRRTWNKIEKQDINKWLQKEFF